MELPERVRAIHEAGHAVVAWYVGARVDRIELVEGTGKGGETLGRCHYETYYLGGKRAEIEAREGTERDIAGIAAQVRVTGEDFDTASRTSGKGDREKVLAIRAEWLGEWDEIFGCAYDSASRIIEAGWPAIEALAARLQERRELGETEIVTLMSTVWADARPIDGVPTFPTRTFT